MCVTRYHFTNDSVRGEGQSIEPSFPFIGFYSSDENVCHVFQNTALLLWNSYKEDLNNAEWSVRSGSLDTFVRTCGQQSEVWTLRGECPGQGCLHLSSALRKWAGPLSFPVLYLLSLQYRYKQSLFRKPLVEMTITE